MFRSTNHFRFAARQLRRNPGFATTAILTLAVGIGATTAIFSIFYAVLLRPLPYSQPDRLMSITSMTTRPGGKAVPNDTSYLNFRDWRAQAQSFESMASYHGAGLILNANGSTAARSIVAGVVSSDFFHVLRIQPALGRTFTRQEELEPARVVVLSSALWASAFHSSPQAIGQSIKLSDELYTIIGVLPEGATFPFLASVPIELWMTPALDAIGKNASTEQRGWNQLDIIARLKPGVPIEAAQAEMNTIARNLAARYPESNAAETSEAVAPALEKLVGDVRPALRVLFAAVAALLLIACANVAGLLLARGTSRQPELAVRAALGASRSEITLQLLAESMLLALAGGAGGVTLAALTLKGLLRFLPKDLPRLDNIVINTPVLLFAIGVSLLTGIIFGLLPARRLARLDPALALRDATRTSTAGRQQHRLHAALVITETALGLILLAGAGLFLRSFFHLLSTDPGFNPKHVLTFRVGLSEAAYPAAKRAAFFEELVARLRTLPGAESATAAYPLPFSGGDLGLTFAIEGRPVKPGEEPEGRASLIAPHYFESLEIPLVHGRFFDAEDQTASAPHVLIVNEAFVKEFFPREDPLGKRLHTGFDDEAAPGKPAQWSTIVGVVRDVKRSLSEEPKAEYYAPYAQAPIGVPSVAIRVSGDPVAYTHSVTEAVASLDKEVPVYRVRTFDENMANASAQPRFQALLLTAFAGVALLLAAIGLYAVLSYMVVQRTHELGLRMALGAQRGSVLALILRRGLLLAAAGVVFGLAIALPLTRLLGSQLYGVEPLDPLTYLIVATVLLLVSAAASLIPAARAASLDPMTTLRNQ